MKKILSVMALAAMVMAACQKETTDLSTNQALATTSGITAASGLNSLDANSTTELGLRHRPGRDSSCRNVPLDSLAQSIKDYVAANYPGSTIEMAAKDKDGNIYTAIKLPDGSLKILQFDSNGNFVKELDKRVPGPKGPRGPNGPKNHDKKLTPVDPSALLSVITDYISSNYSGAAIERAGTTATGEFIVLINLNGSHKALLFDASGNFVKELK